MTANLLRHVPNVQNGFDFCNLTSVCPSTYKKYRNNLQYFSEFLTDHNYPDELPLPASAVRKWLEAMTLNGLKVNTIRQRLSAVRWLHTIHDIADEENPTNHPSLIHIIRKVKQVRSNKGLGNKPTQKEPLRSADVKTIVDLCPTNTLHGLRNKALLLFGFYTAFRRTELVELQFRNIHISQDEKKARITLDSSKTDRLSDGQSVTVCAGTGSYCPLQALQTWKEAAGISSGFIFRRILGRDAVQDQPIQGHTAAQIIKLYCEQAGYDPAFYAGHSLRRGMMISALEQGKSLKSIQKHARHYNTAMTEHYLGDAVNANEEPTEGLLC